MIIPGDTCPRGQSVITGCGDEQPFRKKAPMNTIIINTFLMMPALYTKLDLNNKFKMLVYVKQVYRQQRKKSALTAICTIMYEDQIIKIQLFPVYLI
jgi:hypothetical protein